MDSNRSDAVPVANSLAMTESACVLRGPPRCDGTPEQQPQSSLGHDGKSRPCDMLDTARSEASRHDGTMSTMACSIATDVARGAGGDGLADSARGGTAGDMLADSGRGGAAEAAADSAGVAATVDVAGGREPAVRDQPLAWE